MKMSNPRWNVRNDDISSDGRFGAACFTAYLMSRMDIEAPDPFLPMPT